MASSPVGVDTELEEIVVGVSVTSTFVLLKTVVRSSCVVAEMTRVEVAATPPAVVESVSTDVTTTNELLVKIEVVRRIEVDVTGSAVVTGSAEAVTDSGADATVAGAASVGHTPASTTPKGLHWPWMNFCAFVWSAALQVLEIQQFVPVCTFSSLHMHFVSLISQVPPTLFGVWNF